METNREELSQQIMEKIGSIFTSMHNRHRSSHHRAERGLQTPFSDLELSRKQIFFLFIIAKKDGISVKDIARFSHVTSGAVTQFIDTLIEKNLLKREEDPEDRRGVKIKLTDYAKTRFENLKKGFFTSISPIFDNLDDSELKTLFTLLDKMKPSDTSENF